VNDPAAHAGLARWRAYAHPVWMAASIALAGLARRNGLALRRARRRHGRRDPSALRAHLALAKPAVVALLIGFCAGPLSMVLLRGRDPFETAHGWIGATAIVLFVSAAWLGRRLERGRSRAVDAHALLALLAVLAAGVAALAGFVLLP
jgi:hypothetical protein